MTRSQVAETARAMPPQMAQMVNALLKQRQTAVGLVELFCLSARTQLSKARRLYGIPVRSRRVKGRPYHEYWLDLEGEEQA